MKIRLQGLAVRRGIVTGFNGFSTPPLLWMLRGGAESSVKEGVKKRRMRAFGGCQKTKKNSCSWLEAGLDFQPTIRKTARTRCFAGFIGLSQDL